MPVSVKGDETLGMGREITPAWSAPLPAAIEGRVVVGGGAESLAGNLFSLEEPWQARFLDLVANLATSWAWSGQRPTQDEVTAWLAADLSLYQQVKRLLDAWRRPILGVTSALA